jgi:hypothetical protein
MSTENIGDSTAPGTEGGYLANYSYTHLVTTTSAGNAASINVWFLNSPTAKPTTGSVKCALYGYPTHTLIAATEEKAWSTINYGEWTTFSFASPPDVSASTSYLIAVWSDKSFSKAKGAGGSGNWGYKSIAYGNWEDPYSGTHGSAYSDVDIYMAVTVADTTLQISVSECEIMMRERVG